MVERGRIFWVDSTLKSSFDSVGLRKSRDDLKMETQDFSLQKLFRW